MEDALELSQASLDQRMRWHLKQTQQLTEKLEASSENLVTLEIENFREISGASEMTLFSRQGRIIASSSVNPGDILPSLPDEHIWLQLRHAEYVALAPIHEEELMIRVIVTVKTQEPQYLQALYPVPVRIADLADSVEFAFVRYQEMNFLRNSLKMSFSLEANDRDDPQGREESRSRRERSRANPVHACLHRKTTLSRPAAGSVNPWRSGVYRLPAGGRVSDRVSRMTLTNRSDFVKPDTVPKFEGVGVQERDGRSTPAAWRPDRTLALNAPFPDGGPGY